MNIFVLDQDPKIAAHYHCDKHVVKMILESAQMMCTTVRLTTGLNVGYKIAFKNHPCTKWVRRCICNYYWLMNLIEALNDEYKYRFNHKENHKSLNVVKELPPPILPVNGCTTSFAQAMPDKFKRENAVEAYREYYREDKAHLLNYRKTKRPWWLC